MPIGRQKRGMAWRPLAGILFVTLALLSHPALAGPWEECMGLFERGNQAYKQSDFPKAVGYLERAAQMAESAFGPGHPNASAVYNSLSTAYIALGRFNDAEPWLKRALQIRERNAGSGSPDLVPPLTNLAMIYDNQGRYGESEVFYARSVAILETTASANLPGLMITLVNFGNLYQHEGRFGEAEQLYLRALGIVEKALGPDNPNVTFVIDNLSSLYGNEGRYDEAMKVFQRSLALKEKMSGAESPMVAVALTNMATVSDHAGRIDDAERLFKRALAINEGRHDVAGTAAALNNLAAFYRARNHLADAEPLYKRALPLQEKAHGPNHPDVATTLVNMGLLYDRLGRASEAEPLYKRALAIDQAMPGPGNSAAGGDMNALATLYGRLGRASEAEPLFKQALSIHQKAALFNPGNIALTLAGMASFYDAEGRIDEALARAREAVAAWGHESGEANGHWVSDPATRDNQQQPVREFLPEFVRILYQAYANDGSRPVAILDEAFRASQSARGLATAQALAGTTARYAAGSDALGQLIREQQDLSNRSRALASALVKVLAQPPSQRGPQAAETLRSEQASVDARLKAIDARLKNEFPRFVELARAEPVGVADVQRLLGADEAFTAMTLGEKDSYLFVIRKTKADFFKLNLSRADAADRVKALRTALVDDEAFPVATAQDFYDRLFGPADAMIGTAKNLIVVCDGALESLPLAVLVTAQGPAPRSDEETAAYYRRVAWLVRRQAVTILPAASSLVSLRSFAVARRADLAFAGFGNPDLQGNGGSRGAEKSNPTRDSEAVAAWLRKLPSLPDTADELRADAKLLGAPLSSLHLGSDASVTTVKSLDLSNTRVIAFATHAGVAGELAGVNEPALVLTPPQHPTADDDGLLRASQVSQLRLNADFVILSACNTAATDGTPGAEGLSGLAKAFFYAGARSLLVSHWEVQSEATVKLTTGLIGALSKDSSIGRAEALRRSMLAMIDNSPKRGDTHPNAWAPFVVAGEGGAGR